MTDAQCPDLAEQESRAEKPKRMLKWREVAHVGTVNADRRYSFRISINERGSQRRIEVVKKRRADAPEGTKPPRPRQAVNFPLEAVPALAAVLCAALAGGRVVAMPEMDK